MRVTLQGIYWC